MALLLAASTPSLGWCLASCRKGAKNPVSEPVRNLSAEACPAQSHGLYKLHADLDQDPSLARGMDLVGDAGPDCRALRPKLPPTWLCVHPPDQDAIISKGIIWRGHWTSDCNEEYRLRTLCAIVRSVRESGIPPDRAWVLDVGSNIGTFTLPLLAAGVNVISIEADVDNLALLNGSLFAQRRLAAAGRSALGSSVLVRGALADTEGLQLCMERASKLNSGSVQFRDAGLAKMSGGTSGRGGGASSSCSRLVRTTTLDSAIERAAGLRLGGADGTVFVAMKMDVQGAEASVMAGASRLLSLSPPSKMFIETQNRSLLNGLIHTHGYAMKSRSKEGCDYNFRLEQTKGSLLNPLATGNSGGDDVRQGGSAGGGKALGRAEGLKGPGVKAGGGKMVIGGNKPAGGGGRSSDSSAGQVAALLMESTSGGGKSLAKGGEHVKKGATDLRPSGKSNGMLGKPSSKLSGGSGRASKVASLPSTHEPWNSSAYTPDVNLTSRYAAACQRGSVLHLPSAESSTTLGSAAAPVGVSALPDLEEWLLVPRLVHQTWKTCEVPPRQRSWWDRCARLAPSWSFALWTDVANRAFVAAHFPHLLSMYDGYNVNIKRVDAIRYLLLYHYGGVYMDLDFACVRSLDAVPLRQRKGLATLILQRKSAKDYEAVSNAFMAAPPRHPFFKFVVDSLPGSANARHVLDATGPRFLTKVYRAYSARKAQGRAVDKDYSVSMEFAPWALLHRVHSCRPQCRPGDAVCLAKPPCPGPYNYAPCKRGAPHELDYCATTMPNTTLTTFWTATWAQEHVDSLRNRSSAVKATGLNVTSASIE